MSDPNKLPAAMRVLVHWYKHYRAETTHQPIRLLNGTLEEFGDPDDCDICIAVGIGMEYPTVEAFVEVVQQTMRQLHTEAVKRGLYERGET